MIKVSWENCISALACLRWSVKAVEWKIWKNVDTIFQNIIVYIATFCLTIIKSQSFPIIFGYYSFMGNLYFDCSMPEMICWNRGIKDLEKCRNYISKQNCLYCNFLLNNYKKSEFSNKLWWLKLNGKLLFWL